MSKKCMDCKYHEGRITCTFYDKTQRICKNYSGWEPDEVDAGKPNKSITFHELNGLQPTEQSCTFKLLEEVGEVMELIGKKSKASGECAGSFEAGDLIMEYMDVAQSAVTAVMVLSKKYGYDLKTVIETHELKLRERGYLE